MDKILVCDNTPQNAYLISRCLENKGYQTLTAETGNQALAKTELFSPDLIILDAAMPDISGFDVCLRLRKNLNTKYTLILIICSLETKETKIRAIESGADDLIEKTFDTEILLLKVASLLRIKHLSDQLKEQYAEIAEKNRQLDFQLKMSQKVQRVLIKELDFKFNNVQVVSKYLPALEIGGDFYQVLDLSEHLMAIIIGDVSGHGISAALLTSMVNLMIKNISSKYVSPDEFLFHMNNEFYNIFANSEHEMYTCMFYAIINTLENKIYYSNAGQVYPIYVSSDEGKVFELEARGLPVGLMSDSKYSYNEKTFKDNDLLLFITDGLIDVFFKENPDEFFERIKELLIDMKNIQDLKQMVALILSSFYVLDISDKEKYEIDDVSLVLCKLGINDQ